MVLNIKNVDIFWFVFVMKLLQVEVFILLLLFFLTKCLKSFGDFSKYASVIIFKMQLLNDFFLLINPNFFNTFFFAALEKVNNLLQIIFAFHELTN